jgi:hypothetical protein
VGPVELKGRVDHGTYAFRFSDGSIDTIAVCSPRNGGVLTCGLRPDVSVYDAVGEAVPFDLSVAVGSITLHPGFPVYIRGKSPLQLGELRADSAEMTPPSVCAGEQVSLKVGELALKEWEMPFGWPSPEAAGAGGFTLTVPKDIAPGNIPSRPSRPACGGCQSWSSCDRRCCGCSWLGRVRLEHACARQASRGEDLRGSTYNTGSRCSDL